MYDVVISRGVEMTMTAIEKEVGVAMPMPRVVYAYPYEEMEVGDSFLVPVSARSKVLNANYRAGKRLGMRFIARTEGEMVRVWRVG
jgi:hypothetical protein